MLKLKKAIVFCSGIVGVLLFAFASIIGGLQIEGYSPISQYISESYATGIPNADYLRYLFIASGMLFALFAFSASRCWPRSWLVGICFIVFGIFYGLGTLVTGFFPCDLGCRPDPENASLSQFIHNTMGFSTYAVVPFSLIGMSVSSAKRFNRVSLVSGIVSLVFVAILFSDPEGAYIGLFQRIIETSILSWVVYTAYYIRTTHIV